MFDLRAVTDEDYDFLWRVASTTMRGYVEAVWGWDEEWQERRFRQKFDPAKWRIITATGKGAGGQALENQPASLSLDCLYLLPEFQRRGIGSAVVKGLMAEAQAAGLPLTLNVLRSNPDALRLYKRLGLWVVDENAERFFMSTGPPP